MTRTRMSPNWRHPDPRDPDHEYYVGTCPVCKGDTGNYSESGDEDGIRDSPEPCDDCKARAAEEKEEPKP